MSFSHETKLEVLSYPIQNECCKLAFLSAVIKSCGELTKKGKQIFVELKTDVDKLFDVVNGCLKTLYGATATLREDDDLAINKTKRFVITLPQNVTSRILFDCGVAKYNADGDFSFLPGQADNVIENECCLKSYIKGVFVTASTSNIVVNDDKNVRTGGGYHWEFVFSNEIYANDFSNLLFSVNIPNKKSKRKNLFVLYIKEAEKVSDLLAIVGAMKNLLKLQNEMTLREVRNNINRQNNCLSANISKTVNASLKQISAITTIQKTIGFDALPQNLRELCLARLANPEESLENLTKLLSHPITKSGVNHQFDRIFNIAEKIKSKKSTNKKLNRKVDV